MTAASALLLVVVLLPALAALAQLVVIARVVRTVPRLADLPLVERERWPRVSVIMTARNEEEALAAAVGERLTERYPDLELILVDDRSTDGTPGIADELARRDPRLQVVHLHQLPEGWLGKLHALHQGAARATGEWLVFSDADVATSDGVYRRLIAWSEERRLDHVVVLPAMRPAGPLIDALVSLFLRIAALSARVEAIEDPRSRHAVGAGAFNLVRRSALERTPGFEELRMEVADDLALGQMLKAHGARQSILSGVGLMSLTFFRRLGDALRSSERATWTAVGRFSLPRLAALSLVTIWVELTPLVALLVGSGGLRWVGAAGLGLQLAAAVAVNRWLDRGLLHLTLLPAAQLLTAWSMLRAGLLGWWRGGIVWRGTFYPDAALRAGRRVRL